MVCGHLYLSTVQRQIISSSSWMRKRFVRFQGLQLWSKQFCQRSRSQLGIEHSCNWKNFDYLQYTLPTARAAKARKPSINYCLKESMDLICFRMRWRLLLRNKPSTKPFYCNTFGIIPCLWNFETPTTISNAERPTTTIASPSLQLISTNSTHFILFHNQPGDASCCGKLSTD